jgi:hypothetical protein
LSILVIKIINVKIRITLEKLKRNQLMRVFIDVSSKIITLIKQENQKIL